MFQMMNKRKGLFLILSVSFLLSSFTSKVKLFNGVKTVVIDAGHGGKDPGCHGVKHKEKDVALAVALKLGKFIEDNFKDIKVIYTRKTDVFVELTERAAIANRANADLFICIHCNASVNKEACGSETYVMGLHKTKGNLEVAKRENASILLEDDYQKKYEGFDPNSDEAAIIFSFYQNAYLTQSLSLASKIQGYYADKAGRKDKGVKQAGFLVLWKTAMPSLLTEIGFLTNPAEEMFLGSAKGQDYIASSIFLAFRDYKNEIDGVIKKYNDEFQNKTPYKFSPADTVDDKKVEGALPVIDTADIKKETPKLPIVDSADVKNKAPKNNNIGAPKNTIDKAEADSVYLRVQFMSSDKQIEPGSDKFNGIENVKEYQEAGMYKYTAGNYTAAAPATRLQKEMREKGFKDAFVVAFKAGKRIPLNDALKQVKP